MHTVVREKTQVCNTIFLCKRQLFLQELHSKKDEVLSKIVTN